jgi:hypothetical protein
MKRLLTVWLDVASGVVCAQITSVFPASQPGTDAKGLKWLSWHGVFVNLRRGCFATKATFEIANHPN